jgi:Na+/H+-dicarboxylate symporter
MNQKEKMIRFTFWVHFACGAFFGLFVGFSIWARSGMYDSAIAGWACMIGAPIICGLILGIAKIRFNWDNFSKRGKNW